MQPVDDLWHILSTVSPVSIGIAFVFGTLVGSFVNVCIGRMPVGKSIVWPGSACNVCGVPLEWWHNVPIISYLALAARCHFCGSPLHIRYLLLEALTGGVAAAVFWSTGGASYAFLYYYVFSCLLIIVFFVDLDAWIILDEITYFGIVCGIVGSVWLSPQYGNLYYAGWIPSLPTAHHGGWGNALWALAGAVIGFGMFYCIALLGAMLARQEAMGRGDVKFAAMIGAFLGPQKGFLALLLSFPLGAMVAIPMLVFRGKGGKTPIPFGTFMAIAAFLAVVHVMDRLLPIPLY